MTQVRAVSEANGEVTVHFDDRPPLSPPHAIDVLRKTGDTRAVEMLQRRIQNLRQQNRINRQTLQKGKTHYGQREQRTAADE